MKLNLLKVLAAGMVISLPNMGRAEAKISFPVENLAFTAGVSVGEGIPLTVESSTKVTNIRVTNLPSGLKYDAKMGIVKGVPKKAGEYKAIVQATEMGGAKTEQLFPMTVMALPAGMTGYFSGYGEVGGTGVGQATYTRCGTGSFKVNKTGNVTGKLVVGGKTSSFSCRGLGGYVFEVSTNVLNYCKFGCCEDERVKVSTNEYYWANVSMKIAGKLRRGWLKFTDVESYLGEEDDGAAILELYDADVFDALGLKSPEELRALSKFLNRYGQYLGSYDKYSKDVQRYAEYLSLYSLKTDEDEWNAAVEADPDLEEKFALAEEKAWELFEGEQERLVRRCDFEEYRGCLLNFMEALEKLAEFKQFINEDSPFLSDLIDEMIDEHTFFWFSRNPFKGQGSKEPRLKGVTFTYDGKYVASLDDEDYYWWDDDDDEYPYSRNLSGLDEVTLTMNGDGTAIVKGVANGVRFRVSVPLMVTKHDYAKEESKEFEKYQNSPSRLARLRRLAACYEFDAVICVPKAKYAEKVEFHVDVDLDGTMRPGRIYCESRMWEDWDD